MIDARRNASLQIFFQRAQLRKDANFRDANLDEWRLLRSLERIDGDHLNTTLSEANCRPHWTAWRDEIFCIEMELFSTVPLESPKCARNLTVFSFERKHLILVMSDAVLPVFASNETLYYSLKTLTLPRSETHSHRFMAWSSKFASYLREVKDKNSRNLMLKRNNEVNDKVTTPFTLTRNFGSSLR